MQPCCLFLDVFDTLTQWLCRPVPVVFTSTEIAGVLRVKGDNQKATSLAVQSLRNLRQRSKVLVAAAVAVVVVNRSFLSPVVISTIRHRYTFSLSRYTFSCLVETAETASGSAEAASAVKERPLLPVVDTSVAPTATVDTVDRPFVSVVVIDAPSVTVDVVDRPSLSFVVIAAPTATEAVDVVDRPSLSVVAAVAAIAIVEVVDGPSLSFVDSIAAIIVVVETGSRLNQDLTKHT